MRKLLAAEERFIEKRRKKNFTANSIAFLVNFLYDPNYKPVKIGLNGGKRIF